jgi:YVTN family beta-propeller protein
MIVAICETAMRSVPARSATAMNWVTILPDDNTAYVANPQMNDVSVVDIKSLKEVARVPVGFAPSRNTAWLVAP